MSLQSISASARARVAASRSRPGMERSSRTRLWSDIPIPTIAQRSAMSVTLQDADEVLLQAVAGGGVGQHPALAVVADPVERLAHPDEARRHDRVGGQRPARRSEE